MKKSNLVGKMAFITDCESMYHGEWGIISGFDGEYYYIRIANGADCEPVFSRTQFRVPRERRSSK